MKSPALKKLIYSSLIAALYTALGMVLAPISFGQVQLRVCEALTILPVFGMSGVWGVTLGCALTNLIGMATGANILGALDVLLGTLATFFAALLSYALRNRLFSGLPVLSTLPPVLLNALVVGWELNYVLAPAGTWNLFPAFAGFVALGQLAACTLLGLLLYRALERCGAASRLREIG